MWRFRRPGESGTEQPSSDADTVLFFLRIEKEKNGVAKFVSFSEGEKEMGAKNVSPLSLSEKESLTTSHH